MSYRQSYNEWGAEGTRLGADQLEEMRRQVEAQQIRQQQEREELRIKNRFQASQTEFDVEKFDAETEAMREQWEEQIGRPAAAAERDRLEHVNAESWIASQPRYIKSESNSQNMRAYLRENSLPATPVNLEKAFQALVASGLVDAKPAPVKPAIIITEEDAYNMPLEELEELSLQQLAQEAILNRR